MTTKAVKSASKPSDKQMHIAHHMPHRTRLKVAPEHRTPERMTQVHQALARVPGVEAVHVNHRTGSVVLHHEPSAEILGTIANAVDALEGFEGIAGSLIETVEAVETFEIAGIALLVPLLINVVWKFVFGPPTAKEKAHGVVHHVHGRSRLLLPKQHRSKENLETVHEALKKVKGIEKLEVNHRAGSITIHHDADPKTLRAADQALKDAAAEIFEALVEGKDVRVAGMSVFAHLMLDPDNPGQTKQNILRVAALGLLGYVLLRKL